MKAVDVLTGELVDVKFFTQWQTPLELVQEPGSPETKTEMAYVPPKVQIEDMMRAGLALDLYRKGRFGVGAQALADAEELEVGIELGADLVDVQRAAEALTVRLSEQEKRAAVAAGEAAKAADERRIQDAAEKLLAAREAAQGGGK